MTDKEVKQKIDIMADLMKVRSTNDIKAPYFSKKWMGKSLGLD